MPFSKCIRCMDCDGFPCLVHAKADAEVIAVRPALTFPNVTLLTNARAMRLVTNQTGTAVTEVHRRSRRRDRDLPGRDRRGVMRRRKLCPPAARVRQRPPPARPRQRIGSGGPQLHVPQQHGGARGVEGAEPDALPEDARASTTSTSADRAPTFRSAIFRCSASRRRRCSGAKSASPSWRRCGRWRRWPRTRSTSGCARRICRAPTTA